MSKDFDTIFDTWGQQAEIIDEIPYGSTVTLLEQPANFEKIEMNVYNVPNYEPIGENGVRFVHEMPEEVISIEFKYQSTEDTPQ